MIPYLMLSNMPLHMVQFLELVVGLLHSNDMMMQQCIICAHSYLGFYLCRDKMILYLCLLDMVSFLQFIYHVVYYR